VTSDEQEMTKGKKKSDLEERLIDFAVRVIFLASALPKTKIGNHISGQMIRSGTSPAPNYGEAQDAESRSDFIHKVKIVLKELRETRVWLLMIAKAKLIRPVSKIQPLIDECDELISIFVKSAQTARRNCKKPS
jgi:four helix bundle protein